MRSATVMLHTIGLFFIATFSPCAADAQSWDDEVVDDTPQEAIVKPQVVPAISAAGFDRLLESGAATPQMLRDRMEPRLLSAVVAIRKLCGLTGTQCHRIELAGRRDISLRIDSVEQMRMSYLAVEQPGNVTPLTLTEIHRRVTIPSLQQFADSSLFRKVARRQLTDAQWVQYVAWDREQQEQAACKAIAFFFGRSSELTTAQEQAMVRLFLEKYPCWRPISANIASSEYVAAMIAGELEAELKPILAESQSRHLQGYAFFAKRMEPQLVKLGLWPISCDAEPRDCLRWPPAKDVPAEETARTQPERGGQERSPCSLP